MAFDSDYSSEDEEDVCPLCIEEMEISDKCFKPCRCGFQVCQFCYHNIRQSLEPHNRCPACRRPYTDEEIEYTQLTPAELKREQERKHRKEQERKQRGREKHKESTTIVSDGREKKNLATIRVIQKNLVYVIGLNPNIPSDELQQMLRRDEYFGQYGKIQKIVINRRVNAQGLPGIGVYVTFARKEDAARCIAAIDGVFNDGKQLRAAYGTTKYCSNYLRGQSCLNTNCMYLHEPGEEVNTHNKKEHLLPHPSSAASTPSRVSSAAPSTRPTTPASAPIQSAPAIQNTSPAGAVSPPWSKPAPIVRGCEISKSDLPNPAVKSMNLLDAWLYAVVPKSSGANFHSPLLSDEPKFPAMFSQPMDEKRRVKAYDRAVSELEKLETLDPRPESHEDSMNTEQDDSLRDSQSSSHLLRSDSPPETTSGDDTTGTAQSTRLTEPEHLDADSANTTLVDLEGQTPAPVSRDEGDLDLRPSPSEQTPVKAVLKAKPDVDSRSPKKPNPNTILKAHFRKNADILTDVLRQVGADLMLPVEAPDADVDESVQFRPSNLFDDGPDFDVRNIPTIGGIGDTYPSVWAAISELGELKEDAAKRERDFAASKGQTRKRLKRIRV